MGMPSSSESNVILKNVCVSFTYSSWSKEGTYSSSPRPGRAALELATGGAFLSCSLPELMETETAYKTHREVDQRLH
jgi:hypothetical protein